MHTDRSSNPASDFSRRDFVKTSALAAGTIAAAGIAMPALGRLGYQSGTGKLKVGVIGCGGRGTGAMADALTASPDVHIHALGDMFIERIEGVRSQIQGLPKDQSDRCKIDPEHVFTGFDAYKKVCETDVDLVILATPPHFRPIHLAEAIARGKHVFMEKPVAVDPRGVRSVIASAEAAKAKNLSIVTGTQRRHEPCYLEAIKRVHGGDIGKIISARCYWNQGGLWMHDRQEKWSDMEWQLRNWLYFTWLSGDHIVEQHVHNLDAINWFLNTTPLKATGLGGRQVRTAPAYGHIFDHFAVEYEYPEGVTVSSQCRQIPNCSDRVEEVVVGTNGTSITASGQARIEGAKAWKYKGNDESPYVLEHRDMIAGIVAGKPLNEAKRIAESTLTAIMGRMSAYTGKTITWEQALNSKLDLAPPAYEMGTLPVPEVAMPGRTPMM